MSNQHEQREPLAWEDGGYFGVCPHCRRNDGYINVGRHHWFFCKEHRFKWNVGANLFRTWLAETEEGQRCVYDKLGFGEFEELPIERVPYPPVPPSLRGDDDGHLDEIWTANAKLSHWPETTMRPWTPTQELQSPTPDEEGGPSEI